VRQRLRARSRPDFPASNAKEFVALLRANPDKFTFSSSGTGATAHLVAELFNSMAGIKARHVPYKGSAPALTDIMNGQIDYTLETIASVASQVRGRTSQMLGVSFARGDARRCPRRRRSPSAAGCPATTSAPGSATAAPPARRARSLARLSAEVQKAIQAPEVKERFTTLGLEPRATSPEEMGAFLRSEQERYADIIKSANIKVE
jgi:tripartite-type tricarboxylate transporter receptor subunit TctC